MKKLVFIRHGEAEIDSKSSYLGWTDVELSRKGIEQSYQTKEKLKELESEISQLYSSPLMRTAQTAKIINAEYDLSIKYSNYLKEINFGKWEKMEHKEIAWNYPREYDMWIKDWTNFVMPEGESAVQAYTRNCKFVDSILQNNTFGTFVIVTHAGTIRNIVSYLLGMKIEDTWKFKINHGSITIIEMIDNYPVLTLLGG